MKKTIHGINTILLDIIVYVFSYSLTNVILFALGLGNNLNSIAVTGRLFNIALPVSIILLTFMNRRLYSLKPHLFWDEFRQIVKATLTAMVLIFFLLYFFQVSNIKTSVSISLFFFLLVDPLARYFYRVTMTKSGFLRTNIIVVGTGAQGQKFSQIVTAHRFTTYNVLGFIDNNAQNEPGGPKILGKIEDIPELLKSLDVDEAVIAIPNATRRTFLDVMKLLEMRVKTIRFIPDMYGVLTYSPEITDFDRVLTISAGQGLLKFVNKVYKRILDLVLSFVGILILIPLFLVVFVLVKLDDGGKVLFTQNRIGRNGRPIKIYKFRTMIPDVRLKGGDGVSKPVWVEDCIRVEELDQFCASGLPPEVSLAAGRWTFCDHGNHPRPVLFRKRLRTVG